MDRRPETFHEGLVKEYREGTLSRSRFCQAKGITVGLLEYAIQKVEKKEDTVNDGFTETANRSGEDPTVRGLHDPDGDKRGGGLCQVVYRDPEWLRSD